MNEKRKCEKCGEKIEKDSKFCSNCGEEILNLEIFCSECGSEINENKKYCDKCGKINPYYKKSNNIEIRKRLLKNKIGIFCCLMGLICMFLDVWRLTCFVEIESLKGIQCPLLVLNFIILIISVFEFGKNKYIDVIVTLVSGLNYFILAQAGKLAFKSVYEYVGTVYLEAGACFPILILVIIIFGVNCLFKTILQNDWISK